MEKTTEASDKLIYEGQVKHDETHFKTGKIGFWIKGDNGLFIHRILEKITPSWMHWTWPQIAVPATQEEVEDWEMGDEVKITVERIEDSVKGDTE
jgi:hypothetical protein